MIVVANRIPVAKGFEKEFEERFRNRAGLVEKMAGFSGFELLRPIKGDCYLSKTSWESYDAFKAWTESAEFEEAHKRARTSLGEMFAGESKLEIHEIIQTSKKGPSEADSLLH